jgi:hypothetical protein
VHRIRFLFLTVSLATLVLTSPLLLVIPFGHEIFAMIFGKAWTDAGTFSAILAISAWLSGFGTVVEILPIVGHNHWYACPLGIRFVLTLVAIWVANALKLSLIAFAAAMTAVWAITYLVTYALSYAAILRIERGDWGLLNSR